MPFGKNKKDNGFCNKGNNMGIRLTTEELVIRANHIHSNKMENFISKKMNFLVAKKRSDQLKKEMKSKINLLNKITLN